MSQAGRTSSDEGTSLVELVAVLATLALLATLAVGTLTAGRAGADARAAVGNLADILRQARERAVSTTSSVRLTIDVDTLSYAVPRTALAGQLPKGSTLTFRTALSQVASERRGSIRFYSDGTSSGGFLTLEVNGQVWDIRVNWLTGQVATSRKVGAG